MSDADETDLDPSKSQRKRDAHAIKDLGESLVNLEAGQLQKFDLPEFIIDVINETRRIKKHGARKRQLLYLAKQLRQIDSDVLMQQLQQLQRPHKDDVALFSLTRNINKSRRKTCGIDGSSGHSVGRN